MNEPHIIITIIYNRISPVVNVNIVNNSNIPVNIQNNMSSIYIKKFGVLNAFRDILNISNKIPIHIPVIRKANNI